MSGTFCLICSIGCLHGMLITEIFGNVFAFLPGRRLYIDTTGLFLGAVNLALIQYPHQFRLGVELKLNVG